MKENRYFQMIYLLLDKGQMTAPELADYFEVSIRTIYRDIDILSAAGIPIYATQGKGGRHSDSGQLCFEEITSQRAGTEADSHGPAGHPCAGG